MNELSFDVLSAIRMVIVHPGATSHQDEQVASALAVTFGAANVIERREPTEAELNDASVLVLDIGNQLDWDRRNIDHHQLDRTQVDCAYSLLADKLGVRADLEKLFPWFSLGAVMDQQGPYQVAKNIGVTPDNLFALLGPARSYHDQRWATDAEYRAEYTIWLAVELRTKLRLYRLLPVIAPRVMSEFAGKNILRGDLLDEIDHEYCRALTDMLVDYVKPDIVWFLDDRGDGFGLLRVGDNPSINFAKCEGMEGVKFAHKGGFILKTTDRKVDVRPLIRAALA